MFLHGTTSNNNLPKFSMKVNLRVPFFLLTQSSVLWQFQENAMSTCKDICKDLAVERRFWLSRLFLVSRLHLSCWLYWQKLWNWSSPGITYDLWIHYQFMKKTKQILWYCKVVFWQHSCQCLSNFLKSRNWAFTIPASGHSFDPFEITLDVKFALQ